LRFGHFQYLEERNGQIMRTERNTSVAACGEQLRQEFQHLKSEWLWLFLYGVLLTVCGTAAVIFPALTTFSVMLVLGIVLMIGGVATIVASFWAGKWSGMLVQLLVGILYVMVGFFISDTPVASAIAITLLVAAFFVVVGAFRSVAALVIQYPYWGWSLLNGVITFLLGVVIYRHVPKSAIWVLGLLVGLEMLFHGWNWIMLSLAIKNIPDETA
jgi:uncharacterized membrane protein HdeD (DUF308 family)